MPPSPPELLAQIGLGIQGSFRDFLGYQIKLRKHLYEPEVAEQVAIFRFSPQFGLMTHTRADDKHAFGQFKVMLNNPSDQRDSIDWVWSTSV